MRFTIDGPSIPDELLNARDEGRVVFFCGAGVSLAKAKLPDFLTLTKQVISELGVDDDEPTIKLLIADKKIKDNTGVSIVSLDRIFGLLENDYHEDLIETAVAKALKPKEDVDIDAHQILLKLAKTSTGNTQLVTTNFDRLFEKCDENLKVVTSLKLPKLSDGDKLNGIVHLHGIVTEDYKASQADRFVLSSSEFGHAYLADGWATEFIKSILEKYVVVFVGYTAEDPPLRYLLEALNKRTKSLGRMYAFHENTKNDAQVAWGSKGVIPIEHIGYSSLWDSLELWAERAVDSIAWKQSILTKAISGPVSMKDFERAQVAHIVSTVEGMRLLSNMPETLSSEWLCVFDPYIRLKKPIQTFSEEDEQINFFERYGLDDDIYETRDTNDYYQKNDIPTDAWNCFTLKPSDKLNELNKHISPILGRFASSAPALTSRFQFFANWIANVANQPMTIWWAVQKGGLHPDIIEKIVHKHNRENNYIIANTWKELSKVLAQTKDDLYGESYDLEDFLNNHEWSIKSIMQIITYYKPSLQVGLSYSAMMPLTIAGSDEDLNKILSYKIDYKRLLEPEIPDEYLAVFIKKFRHLLEEAIELEKIYSWSSGIDPLYNASYKEGIEFHQDEGLSKYVKYFVVLMKRLIENNQVQAKREYQFWDISDTLVFARLSIWISGEKDIFLGDEAGQVLLDLTDETFWDSYAQRDLLFTLKKRWFDYSIKIRQAIERRLLDGRLKHEFETKEEYLEGKALLTLSRIHWLDENKCSFEFDLLVEHNKLLNLAPSWKDEYSEKADESMQGRGGIVRTDSGFDILLKTPLKFVLEKSKEIMSNRDQFLRQLDPFGGLCSEKPIRAFSSLTVASKQNSNPEWAWNKFLTSKSRESDSPKFMALIAARIINIPQKDLKEIFRSIVNWYEKIAKQLMTYSPQLFDELWNKLILFMEENPEICVSGIKTNSKRNEWVTYAINSPQGAFS